MAQITIGGVVRTTAPMNFKEWKKAWATFARVQTGQSAGLDAVSDIIAFVSHALARAEKEEDRLTPEQIEEQLLASEMMGLQDAVKAIMEENGFKAGEGAAAAAKAQTTTSTATSTASSAES